MAALRQIAFYGKDGIGKSTTKIVSAAEAVSINPFGRYGGGIRCGITAFATNI
ncbi:MULTISPECIES: hypothetical protein [Rhizobium]|uniref:Uncharacterized protein n=1 Tax=Rhizobium indicum TaxID=2583231 RepID=A0ABX6PRA6_9HYPH|nr:MULTISPECIES: hypothetical protein [Rhizobium]QIJ45313.1 hypothetical protein G7039_34725 [Rhizobium leguminosarum]QKK21174.1 hypothetical protein FFM53_032800 [Rhizobium indicum]